MRDAFIDSTTLEGQHRIRSYVTSWLARLDYAGKLQRTWSPDELGGLVWERIEQQYRAGWEGPVVTNRAIAEVIASIAVEDYFTVYPQRRASRYAVANPVEEGEFRRCVLDFVHDLEEFEPGSWPAEAEEVVRAFWSEVRAHPDRWGYSARRGPFVDDEERAHAVALETVRGYAAQLGRLAKLREGGE